MSRLDGTAGSPVAGPSHEGSLQQQQQHIKKQRRKKQKQAGEHQQDHTPVASTSQAVYVPPAAEVQRYSHGKAPSAKTVSRKSILDCFFQDS